MPGIRVVNKKKFSGDGEYIGRPSVFGNPYTHLEEDNLAKFHVSTRQEAVDNYRGWALQQFKENEFFKISLLDLAQRYANGEEITLICYCAPLPCHGDVLADLIKWLASFIGSE